MFYLNCVYSLISHLCGRVIHNATMTVHNNPLGKHAHGFIVIYLPLVTWTLYIIYVSIVVDCWLNWSAPNHTQKKKKHDPACVCSSVSGLYEAMGIIKIWNSHFQYSGVTAIMSTCWKIVCPCKIEKTANWAIELRCTRKLMAVTTSVCGSLVVKINCQFLLNSPVPYIYIYICISRHIECPVLYKSCLLPHSLLH